MHPRSTVRTGSIPTMMVCRTRPCCSSPRSCRQGAGAARSEALSTDGTVSLRDMAVSDDGRLLAYALSDGGSDWQIWHCATSPRARSADTLRWSKGAWQLAQRCSGFYYTSTMRRAQRTR